MMPIAPQTPSLGVALTSTLEIGENDEATKNCRCQAGNSVEVALVYSRA